MRRQGSVLILGVLVTLLFFGMAFAVMHLAVGTERDVRGSVFTNKALYLAETGIHASMSELIAGDDALRDGLGTVSGSAGGGTYQVTATPQADGSYDLLARGTFDRFSYGVDVTLVPTLNGVFPKGAIGLSGMMDERINLKEKFGPNVRIDGGNQPALSVQDPEAYLELIDDITTAIDRKKLDPSVFSGYPTVKASIDGDEVELPFVEDPSPTVDTFLLDGYREELLAGVPAMIPSADRVYKKSTTLSKNEQWGTAADPQVTVIQDDFKLENGYTVTGHGTLIITGKMTLDHNSYLDWTGDIIVMGDKGDAKLINDGALLDVDGCLVLVENQAKKKAVFETKHDSLDHRAQTTINGAILALNGESGKEAEIKLDKGGLLVNGLVVMTGQKNELECKNAASNMVINGSIQVGLLDGPKKDSKFKLNLKGPTYITYDEEMVRAALIELARLPTSLSLGGDDLVTYTQMAWRPRAAN